MLDNTLTGKYGYSRSNTENLRLRIQIKLSKNPKNFCGLFFAVLVSTWNFQYSEKKKKNK